MNRTQWYAEGFRWIGSLFNSAADHFERSATRVAELDPRVQRAADEYLEKVRTRSHLYG
jgi:hypothetical protein